MADTVKKALEELIDTVMIYCNPPRSCNNPKILKNYMEGCREKAEELHKKFIEAKPMSDLQKSFIEAVVENQRDGHQLKGQNYDS